MRFSAFNRRQLLKTVGLGSAGLAASTWFPGCSGLSKKPNVIVIFCDDMGYGDLGVFGNPTIRTPNLDQMAAEGQKWSQFYAAAPVCTPSRAGLLTGRFPVRSGMCSNVHGVLFPNSTGGLPESEITLARALKGQGYATACIGKWHLGHLPQYLPTSHGFDSYLGIPYSNDMDRVVPYGFVSYHEYKEKFFSPPKVEFWNVPLMRNTEIIERPADQNTITSRYTQEAVRFIKTHKDRPFFIYLAHNMPHVPLFASKAFKNKSARGMYGDAVEEIDWGVGQILKTLKDEGLDSNTLVVFTSDNGPWLPFEEQAGSAGPLRDGKATTFEGGMREPTIFRWPGKIKPGVVTGLGSTLDIFPTACALAGAPRPGDRAMDGFDLAPALFEGKKSPRSTMFFYRGTFLHAVRKGPYKAHFYTLKAYTKGAQRVAYNPPLLFNLDHDPSERYNIADKHPDVVADLVKTAEAHKATVKPVKDQLAGRMD